MIFLRIVMVMGLVLRLDDVCRPIEPLGAQPGIGKIFFTVSGDEFVHEGMILFGGGAGEGQSDGAEAKLEQPVALARLVVVVAFGHRPHVIVRLVYNPSENALFWESNHE